MEAFLRIVSLSCIITRSCWAIIGHDNNPSNYIICQEFYESLSGNECYVVK